MIFVLVSCQIRRKMREIMVNQASACDLKELVQKFIPEMIGREIEKATFRIYPLQNVFIRKVKILKAPKFDLGKLMEVNVPCMPHFNFQSCFLVYIFVQRDSLSSIMDTAYEELCCTFCDA